MKKGLYLIFLTFIVNNTYACQEVEIVENIDKINFELNILNLQGNKEKLNEFQKVYLNHSIKTIF